MKKIVTEAIFDKDKRFAACHASSLAALSDGGIIAAWFAGTAEGKRDVGIWTARRYSGQWERPRLTAKENDEPHWNPVLFAVPDKRLLLFFKTGLTINQWKTWVMESFDEGETWSEPRELVPGDVSGGRGPVKNKPIILSNGDWLAPASVETRDEWFAFVDISSDGGKTWIKSRPVRFDDDSPKGKGVIQPTLWESAPGKVHMLLRSTCGWIRRSDSEDLGRTWTPAAKTSLPSNNSGLDLARLEDGRLVLIYNHTSDSTKRSPLNIAVSNDNGLSWNSTETIVEKAGGEFSYPSVIVNDGKVCVVHTHLRKSITYTEYELC